MSIEVEAQPVPQKTTKSHKNSPCASRVKQQQQEGTEPPKGTVRELEPRHGREDTGKGAQGEDGQAKNPATKNALRTAKLSVGLQSTRG